MSDEIILSDWKIEVRVGDPETGMYQVRVEGLLVDILPEVHR